MNLLRTLGNAALLDPDPESFENIYMAMTDSRKIRPQLKAAAGWASKEALKRAYPEAFQPVFIEAGMVIIICKRSMQHPEEIPRIASLHARRMASLWAQGLAQPELPHTQKFIQDIESGNNPDSDALKPLAEFLKRKVRSYVIARRRNKTAENETPARTRTIPTYSINDLEVGQVAAYPGAERAIVQGSMSGRPWEFQLTGMEMTKQALAQAADDKNRHAEIVLKILHAHSEHDSGNLWTDNFIQTANDIVEIVSQKKPGSLLGRAEPLDKKDDTNLSLAIDRMIYLVFGNTEASERQIYQRTGNLAALLAVMGAEKLRSKMEPDDIEIRYWNTSAAIKHQLMKTIVNNIDEITLHDRYLKTG
jgi:hypothetical protein